MSKWGRWFCIIGASVFLGIRRLLGVKGINWLVVIGHTAVGSWCVNDRV